MGQTGPFGPLLNQLAQQTGSGHRVPSIILDCFLFDEVPGRRYPSRGGTNLRLQRLFIKIRIRVRLPHNPEEKINKGFVSGNKGQIFDNGLSRQHSVKRIPVIIDQSACKQGMG